MGLVNPIFASGLFCVGLLLAGASIGASAHASAEDPCYGIAIEIQTEVQISQKSDQKGAKTLAAAIRKRHRLATVPPVIAINHRPSEIPTIVFLRPTDYSCALAISREARKYAHIDIIPQAAAAENRTNTGLISVWWPADSATVIANLSGK